MRGEQRDYLRCWMDSTGTGLRYYEVSPCRPRYDNGIDVCHVPIFSREN